jgi:DNA-3-methyladenine glycosylase
MPRTEVVFGPAGRFYVYRIYDLHWMLNVVTGAENDAAAVLIRGVEGLNGPRRVTAALGVDTSFYGKEARPETGLWFESATKPRHKMRMLAIPRIGVTYAGSIWAPRKLRFVLA